MADFYTEMGNVARELLAPTSQGGLGQGKIELVRYAETSPTNPWDAPSPLTRTATTLKGAARGVSKEMIGAPVDNGGQIVATDLVVIVAPWGGSPQPTDVLEIDGKPATILSVSNIPAAGIVSAVRFIVRG